MKKLNQNDILQALCKSTGKYGMMVSISVPEASTEIPSPYHEATKAAPYLDVIEDMSIIANGFGILLFDSRDEMNDAFKRTVGDDGPTKLNPYKGPARVYALTCDRIGKLMTENT